MFNSIICFKAGIMSKRCDIYWRQRVMGHWQYILSVNTILFVLHSIISLCSFIIPVRIQSFSFLFFFFFWGNFFWSTEDLIWTMLFCLFFFLWRQKKKEKEKKISSIFSTVMGSLQQRLFEMLSLCRRTVDSGFDFKKKTTTTTKKPIRISPRWQVTPPSPPNWRGGQRSPLGPKTTPPLNLWLTVAYFDPLSDE